MRGYPLFSVQIALMRRGELVLGVSSAPCWNGGIGEIAWAEKGQGAWLDGERLRLVDTRDIGKADMVLNDWTPEIEVDPETYEVRADGERLTCEPATELPLAQRFFLF